MQSKYRLYRRSNGMYYALDRNAGKQSSLKTKDKDVAERLIAAKNQASDTAQLNRSMAKIYAAGADPELMTRVWGDVFKEYAARSVDSTRTRVERAFRSKPFEELSKTVVNETSYTQFRAVLTHPRAGNSTNHFLRRAHNFALRAQWLFDPVISQLDWPKVKRKKTIAITADEHARIIASEHNPEHRRYYEMVWETGGSQSDIANLSWRSINKVKNTISFYRDKLDEREEGGEQCGLSHLAIGPRIQAILDQGPQEGYLFPGLRKWNAGHRTTEFGRRCEMAGVSNRQLKSYRYAWAQRAREAGMPEREAMNHLGHKSRAVHAAYAEDAKPVTLPLEHYENLKEAKIVKFQQEHTDPKVSLTDDHSANRTNTAPDDHQKTA